MIDVTVTVDATAIATLRVDSEEYFGGLPDRLLQAGRYLKGRFGDYPPPSGRPQPPRTDRQRRFLFAAIASGEITIPYVRTRDLANSWDVVPSGENTVIVGTSQGYAPLVQGFALQANYHQGTWTPAVVTAAREEGALIRMIAMPSGAFGGT